MATWEVTAGLPDSSLTGSCGPQGTVKQAGIGHTHTAALLLIVQKRTGTSSKALQLLAKGKVHIPKLHTEYFSLQHIGLPAIFWALCAHSLQAQLIHFPCARRSTDRAAVLAGGAPRDLSWSHRGRHIAPSSGVGHPCVVLGHVAKAGFCRAGRETKSPVLSNARSSSFLL